MDGLLAGLNKAQRAAVTSDSAILQVLAPPGSGKTKTLTARVGHLITQGLKPWNIIVCTFTVKAAKEMQERLQLLVGEETKKKLKIGTFHGISIRILRQYRQEAGLEENFGVADSTDSQAIVRRIVKHSDIKLEPKQIRNRISSLKSKGIDCETYALDHKGRSEQLEFVHIFREYQAALKKCKLLDYDDILLRCVALLQSHPECVSSVEAVLVDEFQDTNRVQYDLMTLLAQRRQYITIVGDPDQSIYGWRSAEIENLSRMRNRWPDTITINLEENYRSSGAILQAAQHIIEQDDSRPPKKLQATHTFGHKPVLRRLPTARDEANWLVTEVQRIRALTGGLLQYNDFAVLLRSASLSRLIEGAFGRDKIPYKMVGGIRFYDRKEVQILLDYMRVMASTSHREAVVRVLNTPARGIGDATIEKLQDLADNKKKSFWEVLFAVTRGRMKLETKISPQADRGMAQFIDIILTGQKRLAEDPTSLVDILQHLIKKINFNDWVKKTYAEEADSHWANVEELVAQAADACQTKSDEAQGTAEDVEVDETPIAKFLANAALAASSEELSDAEKGNVVTISTIHAAKGLEWPIVFVPACYNGSIPHSRAENQDEERRLLYVAMTRAKGVLQLSCPIKDSQQQETTLSTFLAQSGVKSFFEERGPSIRYADAQALARVLAREEPIANEIASACVTLEREEDDWWPVNGDAPVGQLTDEDYVAKQSVYGTTRNASWTAGSHNEAATGPLGFQSSLDRFKELQEEQDKIAARKLERTLSAEQKISQPKGRKRQIVGQGSLTNFVIKKEISSTATFATHTTTSTTTSTATSYIARPLNDITNVGNNRGPHGSDLVLPSERHSIRTQPGWKRARTTTSTGTTTTNKDYLFLSSSPTKAEESEEEIDQVKPPQAPQFRPAVTLHTTSLSTISKVRRTLGMRGPMPPWKPPSRAT